MHQNFKPNIKVNSTHPALSNFLKSFCALKVTDSRQIKEFHIDKLFRGNVDNFESEV